MPKEKKGVKRRGREIITRDILEASLTPQKKMRIMYSVNLNYARFSSYFREFIEKGFIEQTKDSEGLICYCISERGKILLAVLKKANELAFSDEL
jgi:predicted transcriptional regulator